MENIKNHNLFDKNIIHEKYKDIYITMEYDLFKHIPSNRKKNNANVNRLIESMKEQQLTNPITVNKRMEVIDGQHRLAACQELELPVYYYIEEDYGKEQMQRANLTGITWKKPDFLNAYLEDNNENYKRLHDLIISEKLTLNDILYIISKLSGKNILIVNEDFKTGNLSIDEILEEKIIKFLNELEIFSSFKGYKNCKFIKAFMEIYLNKWYDSERMKTKFNIRDYVLTPQTGIYDYINLIVNEIYSYKVVKNHVRFDMNNKKFYII